MLEPTSVVDRQKPTKVWRARASTGALELSLQPGCKHWQEVRRAHTVLKSGMHRQPAGRWSALFSCSQLKWGSIKTAAYISKQKEQMHCHDPGCPLARNACLLWSCLLRKSSDCELSSWERAKYLGPGCQCVGVPENPTQLLQTELASFNLLNRETSSAPEWDLSSLHLAEKNLTRVDLESYELP